MNSKFEIGDTVVCINECDGLKFGSFYHIKGVGNLTMNAATDKKGPGFCVEDQTKYVEGKYGLTTLWLYFTEHEMNRHFITDEENYKMYLRDQKISEIILK